MTRLNKTIYGLLGRNPVHPFPARMAPDIVSSFLSKEDNRLRVLDPMMGSGTVVALAQASDHRAIGYDIDPLATLIAKVWTSSVSAKSVRQRAIEVLERAKVAAIRTKTRASYPRNSDAATRDFIDYWFDGLSRRQLTCLSNEIARTRNSRVRDALWCAFSRLIIVKQVGASRAQDLAHSRPHRSYKTAPAKPFPNFMFSVEHVLKNLPAASSRAAKNKVVVGIGDARRLRVKSKSIDLVLTSPPYLNAIDYIRCSKFSLVWMGYSVDRLRGIRSRSVGAEIGREYKSDPELYRIIKALNVSKLPERKRLVIGSYIADMRSALHEVARVLVPGGRAVYVIGENTIRGTYVRNATMLELLAKAAGLKLKTNTRRILPQNRRYMPPPSSGKQSMDARMRSEVILQFVKPKRRNLG